MNLLVLDNDKSIEPYLVKFKDIPSSSRIYITAKNYQKVISKLNTRPVLTPYWLVIISPRLSISQILSVLGFANNLNIIETATKTSFTDMRAALLNQNVEFKILDNTKVDHNDAINYVLQNLKIEVDDRKYLCKRHGYYFPKIVESVKILSGFNEITRPLIRKYTDSKTVYISQITEVLLGIGKTTKPAAVDCIYEFRHAFKYLLNTISEDLDLYIFIFGEVSSGFLSLVNVRDYECDDSAFKAASVYKREKIVNAFRNVSFDRLLYIKTQIDLIEPKSSSIYKLISLIYAV